MADKIRFALFGAKRGESFARILSYFNNTVLVAVCDVSKDSIESVKEFCSEDARFYEDYEDMLNSGEIDAVILCNYFNEHAPAAIMALKKGIAVFSETIPAVTLRECVELCRAVEETNALYMLAENYPYMKGPMYMKKLYESKNLGKVVYADGEYVHPMSADKYEYYTPHTKHWRAVMPSTYYLTHSLAPLMHITGAMPVAVNAKCVYSDKTEWELEGELKKDVGAAIFCEMDNGAIFHITGWAKYAPHGTWYRLCCMNGGAETLRNDTNRVRVTYNDWNVPNKESTESIILSNFGDGSAANKAGHGGGDYWVMNEFIDAFINKKEPFFNVYKAAAMSAVGILAWRSSMNSGKEYKIPNFFDEQDRKKYENDMLSPFVNAQGQVTYPRSKYDSIAFEKEF